MIAQARAELDCGQGAELNALAARLDNGAGFSGCPEKVRAMAAVLRDLSSGS